MRLLPLLARRLAAGTVTLLLVTIVVFGLVSISPGDPLAGQDEGPRRLTPDARAALREMYHLDEPAPKRYVRWLGDLVHGDLGRSFHDRRPVAAKIAERASTSVVLNVTALTAMLLIAIPLGTVSAWRRGSRVDRLTGTLTYALYALPVFWAALLAQLVFAVELRWLPLYGLSSDGASALALPARLADRAAHLVLPVTCLAYGGVAYLSRFVRGVLLDAGAADAALAARARGAAAWAAMARHGTRLAAVPLLTLAGFLLPALVSGSVVVETVFAVPGLGELFVDAAFQRDLPVLLGLTLVSGAATLGGVLAADVACLLIDPRTRRD